MSRPSLLVASVEKVIYFDENNGQCLLEVKSPELSKNIFLSGRLATVYPGQSLTAYGYHLKDSMPGIIEAENIVLQPPASTRTLKKFLKSEALSAVKPRMATLLAEAFPDDLFSVLDNEPEKLLKIRGLGEKSLNSIVSSWREYKAIVDLREFLFKESLPLIWKEELWPFHRYESLGFLKNNPYQAQRRHSLSFELIDDFAMRSGFPHDSTDRITCGLIDTLQNYCKQQGHCAYPENQILKETSERLDIPIDLIENVYELNLVHELFVSDIINGETCIYLKEIWELERKVARQLKEFLQRSPPWGWFNLQKVLKWSQDLLDIRLAPLQTEAIEAALSSSFTIITGGPGTGKTTLIRSLVKILQTQFASFALCSPTGRAAQRLSEATGMPAQTIHRLLKYDTLSGEFLHNQSNPLPVDLLLVDEASMVDLVLMGHLLDALPSHCALILVGDADQIPPVGYGSALQSVINCGRFNTVKLTDIFRQKEKSLIKLNAHRINSGLMPIESPDAISDFHYYPVHGSEQAKETIKKLVTDIIPRQFGFHDPSQIQILVPMNKGVLGTQSLNEELQKLSRANSSPSTESLFGFTQNFKINDKVMVVKNDYRKDVFNGDIGFISGIHHSAQTLNVQFDDKMVSFSFDELSKLTLAYAITIHKSQGSEYPIVVVVISNVHLPLVQKNLIYTAITRGQEHVFLVADPNALQTAITADETNRRWQKLTELLKQKS